MYAESKATQEKPGYATLYVFRDYAEPTALGSSIHIDGKHVVTLNQRGYTWVYLKPGNRNLQAVWAPLSGQKDATLLLDVVAGMTYYVDVTGTVKYVGMYGLANYYVTDSRMNGISADAAEPKLEQCCKYQKPAVSTY